MKKKLFVRKKDVDLFAGSGRVERMEEESSRGLYAKEETPRRLGEGKGSGIVFVVVGVVIVGAIIGSVFWFMAQSRLTCVDIDMSEEVVYEFDGEDRIVKMSSTKILDDSPAAAEKFMATIQVWRGMAEHYGEVIVDTEDKFVYKDSDGKLIIYRLSARDNEAVVTYEYDVREMSAEAFRKGVSYETREEVLDRAKDDEMTCR